jgi:hypothetical protein
LGFKAQLDAEILWTQEYAKFINDDIGDPMLAFRKDQKKERRPVRDADHSAC